MFICNLCDYKTKYITNIKKHINRKKQCNPSIGDIVKGYKKVDEDLMCNYCNKIFTRVYNVRRHQLTCSFKEEALIKIIKEQQEHIIELSKSSGSPTTINNIHTHHTHNTINNNNNVTINITLLAFPNSDVSHITDEKMYQYLIGDPIVTIPKLIKDIHCDPNKPENHNFYIANQREDRLNVWDGEKIVTIPKDVNIKKVIDRSSDHLEKWAENMNEYVEYLDKRGQEGVEDKIEKKVKEDLYNDKDMVKDTISKLKKLKKIKKLNP